MICNQRLVVLRRVGNVRLVPLKSRILGEGTPQFWVTLPAMVLSMTRHATVLPRKTPAGSVRRIRVERPPTLAGSVHGRRRGRRIRGLGVLEAT